jgi:cullin 1
VHFLAATEDYYKKESQSFLAENSISDYLKKVEARLEEEARRVDLYLHSSTNKGVSVIFRCSNFDDTDCLS